MAPALKILRIYVWGWDGILNFDRISATECGLVSIVGGEFAAGDESSGTKKLETDAKHTVTYKVTCTVTELYDWVHTWIHCINRIDFIVMNLAISNCILNLKIISF